MKKMNPTLVACACVLSALTLTGCGNTADSAQDAGTAKTLPGVQENPAVPTEVKSQVATAVQGETQKMDAYSKEMSEKYKNNPPVIK